MTTMENCKSVNFVYVPDHLSDEMAGNLCIPKEVYRDIISKVTSVPYWTHAHNEISSDNPSPWYPIKDNPPPKEGEFYVGMWSGDVIWDEDRNRLIFSSDPKWVQAISHHEGDPEFEGWRGWNHRNGALGGNATHWAYLLKAPKFVGCVVKEIKE